MNAKRMGRLCAAVAWTLIFALSLLQQDSASADIGWPPMYPSGSSVGVTPGEENMVRMVSEVVSLTIDEHEGKPPYDLGESPAAWMRGFVEAEFLMRNMGTEQQTFDVWFPLAATVRYKGLLVWWPENILQDFKLWINDDPASFEQVNAPDVGDPKSESAWARFPITFPTGTDVVVRVNYTIYPSGRRPFGGFEYILQTGAGWYGTIGKATITVTIPDPVTAINVSLSGRSMEGLPIAPQPAGFEINRNTIRWEMTDFEPTEKDNIYVDVLEPGRYHDLVKARVKAASSPYSVDVQLALAAAIEKSILIGKTITQHGGGKDLAAQSNDCYRRALELSPNRADIYISYANWLMRSGGVWELFRGGPCNPELCDLVASGLEKFPNNPQLLEINSGIQSMLAEHAGYATDAAQNATKTAKAYPREATFQGLQTEHALASLTPKPATPTVTPQVEIRPTLAAATPIPEAVSSGMDGSLLEMVVPIIAFLILAVLMGVALWSTYRTKP